MALSTRAGWRAMSLSPVTGWSPQAVTVRSEKVALLSLEIDVLPKLEDDVG